MAIYNVVGMTCDHCIIALTAALVDLPGVTEVDVDLDKAHARVIGHISQERVREAVREAGYDLAG